MTINLRHLLQYIEPFLLTLFLALVISMTCTSFGIYQSFMNLLLGVIFYFSVCYPAYFNTFFVFLLGIFCDYLMQAPLGMNAFLMTFMHFLSYFNRQNILTLPFHYQWLVFALLNGIVFVVGLILLKTMYITLSGMDILFLRYVFVCVAYPFVAYICGGCVKKMESLK